ncbi:Cysteine-rich secretory protein family [Acididesulfobacillus acetoxydans]|uniref:Cysteine-rich secretory protein family n=1 Tax=Acididesulfobacillus acetoxydans TaxID=1561005 RepID=A0A8S0XVH8_9FIRM|nr:CAP domain-containing protein [Acididesulfobacillus acetoxydans]CAA7600347.1 Cysteine-rich secretory protein family [Acididesulfobacillus acetoxydans]CEJ07869.1 Cysteine-rich secretory protein family [Acididesulfobacillus acetoxydans]
MKKNTYAFLIAAQTLALGLLTALPAQAAVNYGAPADTPGSIVSLRFYPGSSGTPSYRVVSYGAGLTPDLPADSGQTPVTPSSTGAYIGETGSGTAAGPSLGFNPSGGSAASVTPTSDSSGGGSTVSLSQAPYSSGGSVVSLPPAPYSSGDSVVSLPPAPYSSGGSVVSPPPAPYSSGGSVVSLPPAPYSSGGSVVSLPPAPYSSGGSVVSLPPAPPTGQQTEPAPPAGANSVPGSTAPTLAPATSLTPDEQSIVDRVNQERAAAGLKPLQVDLRLVGVAQAKASDMEKNHYFGHTSPTYGSPWAMMQKAGLTVTWAGENIAGNDTAAGAMAAWMASPGHRANILDPKFTNIGVGIAYGSPYNIYVQEFLQE